MFMCFMYLYYNPHEGYMTPFKFMLLIFLFIILKHPIFNEINIFLLLKR